MVQLAKEAPVLVLMRQVQKVVRKRPNVFAAPSTVNAVPGR